MAAPALAAKGDHNHDSVEGPLANAVVSFGHWMQFDRFAGAGGPNDRFQNGHQLIPRTAQIKRGGTINFIIAGFHNVIVYGPGTEPGDVNSSLVVPGSAPPLIDDPNNRLFRGVDPRTVPQDRVEVVVFPNPGRYLVICGVQPHFVLDNMYGFVRVL